MAQQKNTQTKRNSTHKVSYVQEEAKSLSDFVLNAGEILDREVTKFGNSAHIPVPRKHLGKKVKVLIRNGN